MRQRACCGDSKTQGARVNVESPLAFDLVTGTRTVLMPATSIDPRTPSRVNWSRALSASASSSMSATADPQYGARDTGRGVRNTASNNTAPKCGVLWYKIGPRERELGTGYWKIGGAFTNIRYGFYMLRKYSIPCCRFSPVVPQGPLSDFSSSEFSSFSGSAETQPRDVE